MDEDGPRGIDMEDVGCRWISLDSKGLQLTPVAHHGTSQLENDISGLHQHSGSIATAFHVHLSYCKIVHAASSESLGIPAVVPYITVTSSQKRKTLPKVQKKYTSCCQEVDEPLLSFPQSWPGQGVTWCQYHQTNCSIAGRILATSLMHKDG